MWRQRIRISMQGNLVKDLSAVNLHDQELMYPEHRFWEHVKENEMFYDQMTDMTNTAQSTSPTPANKLPILALNEVFIGESLSAR